MRVATIAVLLSLASPALAQGPPTTRIQNCTSAGCHGQQQSYAFLHGPNAVQACDACHEYADPAKHAFSLKRPGRSLCDFCHIDKTGREGPVVHAPFAKGECLSCHDPHGSSNRRMLKKDSIPQLCTECHKTTMSASHAHKPAGEDCTTCHKAHSGTNEKLLILERRALCLKCHDQVGKTIESSTVHHDPVKGDCLQCHTAHASDQIKALKAPPQDLCASCHKETADKAMAAKHKHAAVTDARACLNCHLPHGSQRDHLLAAKPVSSCLECHKKPIKVGADRVVAGMGELAIDTMHKHGPIQKGDCAGCHDVHGGEHTSLLVANYSREFYQQFNEEAYALCLKCHDRQLAQAETTETQTSFRDGSRNLHFVHVVKGGAQGRNCRACHSVHTSRNDRQVSEKVPFGQWEIPLNFARTETGGSCSPGCHKAEQYSRSRAGGAVAPAAEKTVPAGGEPTPAPPAVSPKK